MGKKKDEPREIPIRFDGADNEAEESGEPVEAAEGVEQGAGGEPVISAADLSSAEEANNADAGSPARSDLQVQVDALIQEKSALYDQLLRRQAEFENYRRRVDRERGELKQAARADILIELLPVLDNLERALSSLQKSEGDADALRHGVELIHKQLADVLVRLGLQPVEAVGLAFDPNLHEAVTIEPSDVHEENTVIEEFQKGYKLGDRLLRPSKVKVASSPER